jgi:predicted nucleic acid-binding protein
MIVVDASATVEWLLHSSAGWLIEKRVYAGGESLHAPHVLDLEVAQTFRRLVREDAVSAERAEEALADLLVLRILRHPHSFFLSRIWQLRHNVSSYDAAYVALAEKLDAALLTRDSHLAAASGHTAHVELF